jgi:ribosomal protein L12E/L44/L45/RPP1/RPP2
MYNSYYSAEKINTLLKTAGSNTPAYYAKIFAKALEGNDINSFFNFGGSSSGSVPASQPTKAAPVAEKKAEEKGGKK